MALDGRFDHTDIRSCITHTPRTTCPVPRHPFHMPARSCAFHSGPQALDPGPSPHFSGGSRHLASPPIELRSVCAIDFHARRASACKEASRAPISEEQLAAVAVLDEPPAEEQRGPEDRENSFNLPSNCDVVTCKSSADVASVWRATAAATASCAVRSLPLRLVLLVLARPRPRSRALGIGIDVLKQLGKIGRARVWCAVLLAGLCVLLSTALGCS
jgi:hypothetical protein